MTWVSRPLQAAPGLRLAVSRCACMQPTSVRASTAQDAAFEDPEDGPEPERHKRRQLGRRNVRQNNSVVILWGAGGGRRARLGCTRSRVLRMTSVCGGSQRQVGGAALQPPARPAGKRVAARHMLRLTKHDVPCSQHTASHLSPSWLCPVAFYCSCWPASLAAAVRLQLALWYVQCALAQAALQYLKARNGGDVMHSAQLSMATRLGNPAAHQTHANASRPQPPTWRSGSPRSA